MTRSVAPRRIAPRAIAALAGLCLLGASMLGGALAGATAAGAAEPLAGRAVAERWCATCHVVGEEAQTAVSDAPPFATIAANVAARNGTLSPEWLAFRLLSPHPQMPQVSLTRTEAADLAAYISGLKK